MTTHLTAEDITAAAVAVSIINACRAGEHEGPAQDEVKAELVALHTTRVLQQFGFRREDCAPTLELVNQQIRRHGGWGKSAQPIVMQVFSNCLQCDEPNPLEHRHAGDRNDWRRKHERETGHVAVQRWEMPFVL